MKEFREYDAAAQRFYETLSLQSIPVVAWDIYSLKYDKVKGGLEELQGIKEIATTNNWTSSFNLPEEILDKEHVVVITDAQLRIVHATKNMKQMNGYDVAEVLGNKPKMFQGPDTCQETSNAIRSAIIEQKPFEATVLNYRKDKSTYKCWIKGLPIFNAEGLLVNFIAFEKEVA
ncbi:PAS domain-containing protein [Croceivirga radicis]|uniref:PAS domain-containing protein n=1 Tax=Croceivirga radicis TaxID=1929488 RepID=UPI000255B575|nr:PAS domain-containing protein [Croceivirga radicis]